MRDMPFRLEAVPASLHFTSVEAFCNVAVVGTIFPGALFADAENLSTMTADNLASVPMVDQFGMGVPPFGPAGIRAEHLGFSSRSLNQWCAAALTHLFHTARVPGSNYATQGISLAVGFYGIHGQPHYLSNLFIAISLLTVSCQRPSLISGHALSSSLRRVAPQCLMETRSAFWRDIGNPSKKRKPTEPECDMIPLK